VHVLILAGGKGLRLWPLSTDRSPKQFLQLGTKLSLLQRSILRFSRSRQVKSINISTNARYLNLVKDQLKQIKVSFPIRVIVEPGHKGTLAAIAFSVRRMQENHSISSDECILVAPCDQYIDTSAVLLRYLKQATLLTQTDRIVLFGIKPTYPATGYGYIRVGKKYNSFSNYVKSFEEKPSYAVAKSYLQRGYYWNSGIVMFSPQAFWAQVNCHCNDVNAFFKNSIRKITKNFDSLSADSFDCAILEKSENLLICPMRLTWSDIGCWDSVYQIMKKDDSQNVKLGNVVDFETNNCLIFSTKRLVSVIGLRNLLVVEAGDAVFVCKRGESQKVKEILKKLEVANFPAKKASVS